MDKKKNSTIEKKEIIKELGSSGVYREYKEWNRGNKTLEGFKENTKHATGVFCG